MDILVDSPRPRAGNLVTSALRFHVLRGCPVLRWSGHQRGLAHHLQTGPLEHRPLPWCHRRSLKQNENPNRFEHIPRCSQMPQMGKMFSSSSANPSVHWSLIGFINYQTTPILDSSKQGRILPHHHTRFEAWS